MHRTGTARSEARAALPEATFSADQPAVNQAVPVESVSVRQQPASLSYLNGVLLVLLAGLFWSTIGLGIRSIEQANVWQILSYRSFSLSAFLFILIALRSGFRPLQTIRRVDE